MRAVLVVSVATIAQGAAGIAGASYCVRLLIVLGLLAIADSRRPAH